MSDTLLSIIIPTYNCAEYINEGIHSVLDQLSANCELILTDDGSVDNTRDILSSYENINSNVKVIYNDHKGASGARNSGLDASSGKYVTFMDCDDMLTDNFLHKSIPLLNQNADLYIFGIERIMLNGDTEKWTVGDKIYNSCHDFANEYIKKGKLLVYSNCNKFYKKSIIEKQNLRFIESIEFGEDRLFNYEYIKSCSTKIITSSVIQLKYIQRSLNSMSNKPIPNKNNTISMLNQAKTDCFIKLATNVTDKEIDEFINRSLLEHV